MKLPNPKKLLLFYIAIVFLLSVLPINGNNEKINHIFILNLRFEYLIHALMYIPLGYLIMSYLQSRGIFSNYTFFKSLLWALVFASVMEYIQFFTFWRAFNINDLVANILGVVCGYLLLLLVKKKGSRQ